MNFLSPEALVFAAALPVVILFYLLKRKRVVHLVSSTLLWQRYLAEAQASSPFQRLRRNWLLILQLLLLALLLLALVRPYFAGEDKLARLRVVILDASASMQSTDVAPSRFETARGQIRQLINNLRDQDQMILLLAGRQTVVKQSATTQKAALRRALQDCAPEDVPTRLVEALRMAETLIKNHDQAEIHLFSDGAVSGLEDFAHANLPLVFHRVGERGRNLGWIGVDVRPHPDNPAQRAILARVFNAATNEVMAEAELLFEGRPAGWQTVLVPPTNTVPMVFVAEQPRDGVFTLRLKNPDDLAVDNQVSAVSLLPRPVRVLLVSRGNRFLERALRALPQVELQRAASLTQAVSDHDVVVLDDVQPAVWPQASLLAIHTQNTNWFERVETVENPVIVDWRASHPVLRFVNFDNVYIRESLAVTPPVWGMALVEARQTPLVIAGEINRRRVLWLAFDPLQGNWPLLFTYPIFIANAMNWLSPGASSAPFTLKAGEVFRWPLASPVAEAEVTLPDGRKQSLALDAAQREILFSETSRAGTYQLAAGTNRVVFCVNLADPAESDTTPRGELVLGPYTRATARAARPANLELWRWIALGGLVVLLWEWWYYHKRTV